MSISGKFLGAEADGTTIEGNYAWTAEESGDPLDRTVGTDGGYARTDLGVYDLKISMRLYLDISTGEYERVRRGTTLTNLNLLRNVDDAVPAFSIPEALVVRSVQRGEVRGKMEVEVEAVAQGEYSANDPA